MTGFIRLITLLVCLYPILILPRAVKAQVVINEFMADLPNGVSEEDEEWVELFNLSDQSLNLSGWVLKDKDDAHQLVIYNQTISPKSFLIIKRNQSNFSLNNSSDIIRLFESTQSAQPIDEFAYSQTQENKSWGRIPDGTGLFQNYLDPSPGQANRAPPTTTPKPDPTSKPTPTPVSSHQSEQPPASTISTSTDANPTSPPKNSATPTPEILGLSSELTTSESTQSATSAGIIDRTYQATSSSQASPSALLQSKPRSTNKLPIITITIGVALITAGLSPEIINALRDT